MAGVLLALNPGPISTGVAAKTVLQVVAAANQRVKIKEIEISFDGVASTDVPIKVEWVRQSTAGTMTSLTPVKWNESDGETLQTAANKTATAEPTTGDILRTWYIHPQGGGEVWQARWDGELIVKGGNRCGLRVTAGVSVNCVPFMLCEE